MFRYSLLAMILVSGIALTALKPAAEVGLEKIVTQQQDSSGYFISKNADGTILSVLLTDHYFSLTSFHPEHRQFNYTWGGPVKMEGQSMRIFVEFNTWQEQQAAVGNEVVATVGWTKEGLTFNGTLFHRAHESNAALTGCWRITARQQNGKMAEMPKGPRKTLKLIAGSHFQWVAINTETGEFFGTGGGKYSFEKGQYTEIIEFFSRDSSRVGAKLTFEGKVEGDQWQHSGKSSKGDPIYEIWTRERQP